MTALRHLQLRLSGARERGSWAGCCALTFDDGPDPEFTPQVLATLRTLGVPATFFVVGAKVECHPELVRQMIAEGHAVGSHSQDHVNPRGASVWRIAADYRAGRRTLERVVGTSVPLFRPPYGWLSPSTTCAIRAGGFDSWVWSVDADDWEPGATAEAIVANSSRLRPGDVMLLHDGIEQSQAARDRSQTVAAIESIVDNGRRRGLGFVTLCESG